MATVGLSCAEAEPKRHAAVASATVSFVTIMLVDLAASMGIECTGKGIERVRWRASMIPAVRHPAR
jgi:hypothetical protein